MRSGDLQYYVGVDLGKDRNHTAMAVLERKWYQATTAEFIQSGGRGFQGEFRYRVVGMDRCALGTPYPVVIEWLKRHLSKYHPRVVTVVVDATGVGNPVMDFLRQANLGVSIIGTVIVPNMTGGGGTTLSGYRTISRTELLTNLQIAVQARKFTIETKECRESQALSRELVLLRMEGKRPGVQDDLAFALALAVWWGLRP